MITVPVEVSNRHVHLAPADLAGLFGMNAQLHVRRPISQTGQFAAEETVRLLGPAGTIDHVRVVGPERTGTQIELSATDARVLGIEPPVRDSGDLKSSAGLVIEGPAGKLELSQGAIRQRRHLHASPDDCRRLGLQSGATVGVRVNGYLFDNVFVKVDPSFVWRLHLDTDEALIAHIRGGETGEVVL